MASANVNIASVEKDWVYGWIIIINTQISLKLTQLFNRIRPSLPIFCELKHSFEMRKLLTFGKISFNAKFLLMQMNVRMRHRCSTCEMGKLSKRCGTWAENCRQCHSTLNALQVFCAGPWSSVSQLLHIL